MSEINDYAPRIRWLHIRYKTDFERIKRVVPPPLKADEIAEVGMDWLDIWLEDKPYNIFVPDHYFEAGVFLSTKYREHSGMMERGMPLNQDWGRYRGRETQNLTKKDGTIAIREDLGRIKASLSRRGKKISRIETILTNKPAHPRNWIRESGWAGFRFRYCLNPY